MNSAYQQQLKTQLDAAEDELGKLRRRVAELTEQRDTARAELALLHEGEEPYDDDRLVPTPGQWIWKWNRATPAERLLRAQRVLVERAQVNRCIWEHSGLLDRAEQAEASIAAARQQIERWRYTPDRKLAAAELAVVLDAAQP